MITTPKSLMTMLLFAIGLVHVILPGNRPCQAAEISPNVEAKTTDREVNVRVDQKPVFDYSRLASPNKPYISRLYTPGGIQILRDSPPDHKHHHGLMFAVDVKDIDFWGETAGAGKQVESELTVTTQAESTDSDSNDRASSKSNIVNLRQELDWVDAENRQNVLRETRQIRYYGGSDLQATLLTWRSSFRPAKGDKTATLGGPHSHHYYGLGMRFVPPMDEEGEFVNSENQPGEPVRGSEKLTSARWCAYRSKVGDQFVTVAMFDSPDNPRHPNRFFTMRPFAYLAATLNLWKEPLPLPAEKPLDLTYGIAVWDGHVPNATIEKMYQQWLKREKNPPKTILNR